MMIDSQQPSFRTISNIVEMLKRGNIIIYPTDTVYGLGANALNSKAVHHIFKIKNRPFSIPLPVAVHNFSSIENIAFIDDTVKRIVDCFLPGPITIILQKKNIVSNLVTANLDKIAIRIPDNSIALDLLEKFGSPLTVTSANIHKKPTPFVTRTGFLIFIHSKTKFGEIAVVESKTQSQAFSISFNSS